MASATPANTLVVSMLATSMPIFGVYHAVSDKSPIAVIANLPAVQIRRLEMSGTQKEESHSNLNGLVHDSLRRIPLHLGDHPLLPQISVELCHTPRAVWLAADAVAVVVEEGFALDHDMRCVYRDRIYSLWDAGFDTSFRAALTLPLTLDAVNLEEALYWIFLIRSVHRTREGRLKRIEQWASSRVFSIYLGLAIISTIAHVGVPFFVESDEEYRTIRIFVTEGVSAVFNVLMSIALAWYLPPFIRTVESRGGSKDVIRKLAFFEEMNTIRLFARAVFAAGTLSLGIDGLTTSKALMLNPFANDCLFMSLCLAFWLSMIVSIMLYLPVSYYKPDTEASGTTRREVTAEPVGEDTSALMSRHSKEHKALVTLLRERGTILEDEKVPEDALFYEMEDRTASWPKESRVGTEHDPELAQSQEQAPKSPRPTSQLPRALKRLSLSSPISSLPDAVTRFAGPFGGVPGEELPREVVIRVDQEVEVANQLGETYHSPRSLNRDPQPLRPGI